MLFFYVYRTPISLTYPSISAEISDLLHSQISQQKFKFYLYFATLFVRTSI